MGAWVLGAFARAAFASAFASALASASASALASYFARRAGAGECRDKSLVIGDFARFFFDVLEELGNFGVECGALFDRTQAVFFLRELVIEFCLCHPQQGSKRDRDQRTKPNFEMCHQRPRFEKTRFLQR